MRAVLHTSAGVLSACILLLMPKCPVCLAGYVAVATGLGISMSFAEGLRIALLLTGAGVLALLAVKGACRFTRSVCERRR